MTSAWARADAYARSYEVLRFAIVGGGSTLLYFALTTELAMANSALAASVIAYVISGVFSFAGHRFFTFTSGGPLTAEAVRFALLNLAGLGAASAAPLIVTDRLGFHPAYATTIVCVIAPPLNYLAMRSLVFYRLRSGR